jgi:hypothetical protein
MPALQGAKEGGAQDVSHDSISSAATHEQPAQRQAPNRQQTQKQ